MKGKLNFLKGKRISSKTLTAFILLVLMVFFNVFILPILQK